MRVLHVLPTLGYGGVSKVVLNYRPYLMDAGVSFDFVTHGGREDFHAELEVAGSSIHYIRPIHEVGILGYLRGLRVLDPRAYDVVHIHTGHLTGLYAMLFRLRGWQRIVLHAHASRAVNAGHERLMWVFRLLARISSRWRLACGVAAGDYCFGHGQYTVLPNGLDFEAICRVSSDQVKAMRIALGVAPGTFAVLQVGRLTFEKNHLFMLDVFERYVSGDTGARYLIVGDGPLRDRVLEAVREKAGSESVHLLGQRSDVYLLMKAADVLVLPSLFEGMPMVVIEAQACGLRCMVSDTVDHDVDLGLNLVRFVEMGATNAWLTALRETRDSSQPTVDDATIRERLIQTGYEIGSSAVRLAGYYRMVVGES